MEPLTCNSKSWRVWGLHKQGGAHSYSLWSAPPWAPLPAAAQFVPYAALQSIVPPHGEVSYVLTALIPHRIIDHTSIKMCVIIAVEMVTIYIANYMIQCGQTATTQVSDFLPENGGAGELSILVFCFRTLVLIIQTPNSNLELTKLKWQFVFWNASKKVFVSLKHIIIILTVFIQFSLKHAVSPHY